MIYKIRIMIGYVTTDDSCGILNLMLTTSRKCLGCKVNIPNSGRLFLCMSRSFISGFSDNFLQHISSIPISSTVIILCFVQPARVSLQAGCEGVAAINTIMSVMGINLDTLRPEPCVEG